MEQNSENKHGCLFIGSIVLLTIAVSVGTTIWILTQYIFPNRFDPVELTSSEQQTLDAKLSAFEGFGATLSATPDQQEPDTLQPEKYSEKGSDRQIELSERELNGMLANNTDLAQRLAIDLSHNLASAKLLIPLDPDFPVMGGKTLKLSAGLELAFQNGRAVVILKGVSVMGVPVPNAWLGGMKNVDLVGEFGGSEGFWKAFSEGVENIAVTDGKLLIQLRE
jgi:hypothetical protein